METRLNFHCHFSALPSAKLSGLGYSRYAALHLAVPLSQATEGRLDGIDASPEGPLEEVFPALNPEAEEQMKAPDIMQNVGYSELTS